jgi:inosine triphosphate pyrophosphatase
MNNITFITGNPGKLKEVQAILGNSVKSIDIDLPEIQGSEVEIIINKWKTATTRCKGQVLIEDTSLGFYVLRGLPGPYIKWFYKAIGNDGLYNMLAAYEDKSAHAMCIFALGSKDDTTPTLFMGQVRGTIVPPRGDGFGWDPIFQPDGSTKTFAEMTPEEKNSISHRRIALDKLAAYCNNI